MEEKKECDKCGSKFTYFNDNEKKCRSCGYVCERTYKWYSKIEEVKEE